MEEQIKKHPGFIAFWGSGNAAEEKAEPTPEKAPAQEPPKADAPSDETK